ncbi:MAG: hypothetical protein V3S29_04495 [bacterium]
MAIPAKLKRLFRGGARSLGIAGPRLIPQGRHPIRPEQILPAVAEVVSRLEKRGHIAWIVGGAVRDMVLGRAPKDYDVATDARPEEVKRCFGSARIIGRRFRLVHVKIGETTLEVATFRGRPQRRGGGMIHRDNTWGTPEEDAFRRDFTVNALAFDLSRFAVIDYVGGMADVEAGLVRTIAPAEVSLQEDPVRMLRALRFTVRLGFELTPDLAGAIHQLAPRLRMAKRHRLAEETQRFLTGGQAEAIFSALERYGLLGPMLGLEGFPRLFGEVAEQDLLPALRPFLKELDDWPKARDPVPPAVALLGLVLALVPEPTRANLLGGAAARRQNPAAWKRLWASLPRDLGGWGLLRGQVEPAITILSAVGVLHRAGKSERPSLRNPPAGAREGWMLLLLLRKTLALADGRAAEGNKAIANLAPLVIPEHPPPPRRNPRRPSRRPARPPAGAGKALGQPPAGDGAPRRRRRGSRRRGPPPSPRQ